MRLHIGDLVKERLGTDLCLIIGHHLGKSGVPTAWKAVFFPLDPELGEPFIGPYAYDFADRDAAVPGAHLQWWQTEGCP